MRLYLASTCLGMTKELREATVAKCRPRYILETFFSGERICLRALRTVENENFILDSGAFSYMNGAKASLEEMDAYVNRYIAFIQKYRIKQYMEIDVDNIFGLEKVEEWRRRMEKAVGYPCIPVWHKERGVEYWKQMCREYSYIAIGGLVSNVKQCEYELIKKLVHYAAARGVKVHGLGFTKTKTLTDYEFYSVDSSTYNVSAARGQQIHTFVKGHIETRHLIKGDRKVQLGKLIAHNMEEWVKCQKYMDGVRR